MCDLGGSTSEVARSPSKALSNHSISSATSSSNGLAGVAAKRESSPGGGSSSTSTTQQPSELEQQNQVLLRNMEDMAKETYWLREKLKEMTSDRDRLLCEVANLRLELDMMELKRLPDDNK